MTPPSGTSPLTSFLATQGVVVLDGGLATALEVRGHDLDDPLWSARVLLDDPEEVRAVHAAYLRAGADCIATATYQATFGGLVARGLDDVGAERILRVGVELARDARDAFWSDPSVPRGRLRPLVAASVGPYGAALADGSEYTGRYDLDEEGLVAWHRRRWHVLASAGADLLACETIPSLAEVRALVRLMAETPQRWAWISFQCRDGGRLADGTPVAEAVAACAGAGNLAAVGFNCIAPDLVSPLLTAARSVTDAPLAAYPNSGERYDAEARAWRPGDAGVASGAPPDLAARAPGWLAEGAVVLGGCCRTGPDAIARLRGALIPNG